MNNTIEKSVELKAPIGRVWQALTDYRQFGQWFRVKIDKPFVVGQVSSGNILYPGYEHVQWKVVVKNMDSERLFAFTWHPYAIDANVDYSQETPTLVEFKLSPTSTGTLLTVTESGFNNIPEHRRVEALRMNDGGWTQQMKNIAEYVENSGTIVNR